MKKKPTKKEETPVAVRVARWSAAAAVVTVLGTIFDTMWKERPWWMLKEEAPQAASIMSFESGGDMAGVPGATMSSGPSLGWYDTFLTYLEYRPLYTWAMVGCAVILLAYLGIEYFYRRRKAK